MNEGLVGMRLRLLLRRPQGDDVVTRELTVDLHSSSRLPGADDGRAMTPQARSEGKPVQHVILSKAIFATLERSARAPLTCALL